MLAQLVSLLETKENGLKSLRDQPPHERSVFGGPIHDRFACPKGEIDRDWSRWQMLHDMRI